MKNIDHDRSETPVIFRLLSNCYRLPSHVSIEIYFLNEAIATVSLFFWCQRITLVFLMNRLIDI